MQTPPHTFEEFLQSQNLDGWPRLPYFPEVDPHSLIATLRKDYSLENIAKRLYASVPLSTENLTNMEERLEECKFKVHDHAKKLVHLECSEEEKDQSHLEQVESSASESKDLKKKKKVEFAADIRQDIRCKTAEYCKFPGFQVHQLTNLPRQLEAAQLWESVVKVQTFKGLNFEKLKKLFLSEASVALLQDCFWWWFLQKFKPNQEQQDHLFDRISDSFVALLLSTPSYIKDPFFQMYPDCLSQAIYLTFCEAFPNSQFGDEFKDELIDLIFQWIRGFKPQKCAWKKWNLSDLEKPVKCVTKRDSIRLSISSLFPKERSKSLRFQLSPEEEVKEEIPRPKKESHYVGDGPHFHRSLFNLGGQSPLVCYYLKMHKIPNTLQNSRLYKITHTEVCKEPTPSSPTYQDVIEESKKFTKCLHNDFLNFEHRCNEELAEMKEQREKVNWKFQRLLSDVSKNPNELRLRTQALIQKLENQMPEQTESSTVVKKSQF